MGQWVTHAWVSESIWLELINCRKIARLKHWVKPTHTFLSVTAQKNVQNLTISHIYSLHVWKILLWVHLLISCSFLFKYTHIYIYIYIINLRYLRIYLALPHGKALDSYRQREMIRAFPCIATTRNPLENLWNRSVPSTKYFLKRTSCKTNDVNVAYHVYIYMYDENFFSEMNDECMHE